jgi:hypothetical protein
MISSTYVVWVSRGRRAGVARTTCGRRGSVVPTTCRRRLAVARAVEQLPVFLLLYDDKSVVLPPQPPNVHERFKITSDAPTFGWMHRAKEDDGIGRRLATQFDATLIVAGIFQQKRKTADVSWQDTNFARESAVHLAKPKGR